MEWKEVISRRRTSRSPTDRRHRGRNGRLRFAALAAAGPVRLRVRLRRVDAAITPTAAAATVTGRAIRLRLPVLLLIARACRYYPGSGYYPYPVYRATTAATTTATGAATTQGQDDGDHHHGDNDDDDDAGKAERRSPPRLGERPFKEVRRQFRQVSRPGRVRHRLCSTESRRGEPGACGAGRRVYPASTSRAPARTQAPAPAPPPRAEPRRSVEPPAPRATRPAQ